MGIGNSLAVGFMQAVAIIPGISRSGSTITAGVASGLDREFAAQYTFILSIPTILAGAAVSFKDAVAENAIIAQDIPAYIVGVVVSGVVGFLAIRLLQYILKSKKFIIFSVYSFVVGAAAIIFSIVKGV